MPATGRLALPLILIACTALAACGGPGRQVQAGMAQHLGQPVAGGLLVGGKGGRVAHRAQLRPVRRGRVEA
mgnify:CR=1 FL=1